MFTVLVIALIVVTAAALVFVLLDKIEVESHTISIRDFQDAGSQPATDGDHFARAPHTGAWR
ncbi:hypothetical protein Psed_5228 [Pseudonocardia dioxanivorans CB1190]|uniref:Uncharacterized protein n=1 Tax=Pseudonocardia dioxanivorans (strain ATCC 55486 / DSM 44775 / JCM 13855 / CB1190) TaxID=675635 RepID=F4CTD9_PSEUX|nr:hypothetical protein [Pseudonocardia dioxanivorans]AEA27364.1 hypothetical protein Psed_5228 [Pseudonocardia dioxanivorans CB1190]